MRTLLTMALLCLSSAARANFPIDDDLQTRGSESTMDDEQDEGCTEESSCGLWEWFFPTESYIDLCETARQNWENERDRYEAAQNMLAACDDWGECPDWMYVEYELQAQSALSYMNAAEKTFYELGCDEDGALD